METSASVRKTAASLGFWIALATAIVAVISFALAVTTAPISGPFCQSGCVTYPYANVAAYVPHDYIWMYPGILLTPLFLILMACIHYYSADDKKIFSLIGLSFAVMCAAAITMDYFIQLSVIQPSLLKGETEGLALFSQYNPHGIFIALEDLGYLLMSLAFLCVGVIFAGARKLERAIRCVFIGSAVLSIATFILLSLIYGQNLEYRFEVAVITINWLTLIVGGVLLGVLFWRGKAEA